MKPGGVAALVVLASAVAGFGGYWFARYQADPLQVDAVPSQAAHDHPSPAPQASRPAGRNILYYRHPMGEPDFSAVPKKDAMGMDYIPVYEDEEAPIAPAAGDTHAAHQHDHAAAMPDAGSKERTILYYRNPMGLPDTSPVPKKDSMGMDYIPVYADEAADDGGIVRISPGRVQMLGVQTEAAAMRVLMPSVRAVGTVQFSERQLAVVSTRFEGWIEELYVNATGEPVRRGAPLMRVYSPLLVQTEQEYVDAARMADAMAQADAESRGAADRLAQGALQRLRFLDVPEAELQRLQRERRASRSISWPAPFSGIVLEKLAVEGMRFMPGEPLYRIAGLSPIWVIAEIFEQDLAQVAVGQPAAITVKAYPGRTFEGRVAFVYPTVGAETRTAAVRIEIPNPEGALKADMYAGVTFQPRTGAASVLTVPESAVIDNGARQVVLVERSEGRYEPRPVRTSGRSDGLIGIAEGLREGEKVVVSANFLIDAESNLKAALAAFTAGEHQH